MFNAIPPLFWPVLSVSIVLAGVGLRIRDHREGKKRKIIARQKARLERTNNTFEKVKDLYMTFNALKENFDAEHYPGVTSEAWECVRSIHPELIERRGEGTVPEIIVVSSILSVREWYEFLIDEETRCREEYEELSQ